MSGRESCTRSKLLHSRDLQGFPLGREEAEGYSESGRHAACTGVLLLHPVAEGDDVSVDVSSNPSDKQLTA